MNSDKQIAYLGYWIKIGQEATRFTARVTREDGLISHDGRASQVWASASCGSYDRAVWVAKNAIDTGQIQ